MHLFHLHIFYELEIIIIIFKGILFLITFIFLEIVHVLERLQVMLFWRVLGQLSEVHPS